MLLVGQHVVLLAPINAVGVANEPELLQQVERAVDGRRRGQWVLRAAALDQLGGGDVALRPGQHAQQQPPLRGPAHPARTQPAGDVGPIDGALRCHLGTSVAAGVCSCTCNDMQ